MRATTVQRPGRSCNLTAWLHSTRGAAGKDRAAIVVNGWSGTGIGHSIMASAGWVELLRATDRALRFSFCVPSALQVEYGNHLGEDREGSICEKPHFDLHDHVTVAGRKSLRATTNDLKRMQSRTNETVLLDSWVKERGCNALYAALRGPTPFLIIVARGSANKCLPRERPCTTLLRATKGTRLLPCSVGLHLRTMAADDSKCNAVTRFVDDQCPGHFRRQRHCTSELWPQLADGCGSNVLNGRGKSTPAHLFAASDLGSMYVQTRALGWNDYDDEPIHTSRKDSLTMANFSARSRHAVLTWLTLASCTHAIVAPVRSQFSISAFAVARLRGARFVGCCSDLDEGTARGGGLASPLSRRNARQGRLAVSTLVGNASSFAMDAAAYYSRWLSSWMSRAAVGHCGSTKDQGTWEATCRDGGAENGAIHLQRSAFASWGTLASACIAACHSCSRCAFVSFSLPWRDCSWYRTCELQSLQTNVYGFVSGAVSAAPLRSGKQRGGPRRRHVNVTA